MSNNEQSPFVSAEEELLSLHRPSSAEIIPSTDCEPGYLYWGSGRSIGEPAICRGFNEHQQMQFEGLRNKMGQDFLFTEIHYDDDEMFGTWCPAVKLERAPEEMNKDETMDWLLQKYIEMLLDRKDWLEMMPNKLKSTPTHDYLIDQTNEELDDLLQLKADGFSHEQTLTFRKIMQSKH